MKNRTKPASTRMKTSGGLDFSIASGIKCRKAPPIKAPAEKAIKRKRIVFKNLSLIARVTTPIKEIMLTKKVLMRINKSCIFLIILNSVFCLYWRAWNARKAFPFSYAYPLVLLFNFGIRICILIQLYQFNYY